MTTCDFVFEDPIAAIGALQAIATPVDLKELEDLENDIVFKGAIHASVVVRNLSSCSSSFLPLAHFPVILNSATWSQFQGALQSMEAMQRFCSLMERHHGLLKRHGEMRTTFMSEIGRTVA